MEPKPLAAVRDGARILVCDDSATIRRVVTMTLGEQYDCTAFVCAEALLEAARTQVPELIISDVLMEGMTGFELCEKVRADPALAGVPIILLTSQTSEDDTVTGLENGADEYIAKPVRPRELQARVSSLLRLRRTVQALDARTRQLQAALQDLESAQAALVESEKLASLGTLVAGVAHEINNPLAFMKSGLSCAGEIADELASSDDPATRLALAREVHEISRDVQAGIDRLSRIASDLRATVGQTEEFVEEVPLAEAVRQIWKLACMPGPLHPQLVLKVDPELAVLTVRSQLLQALQNVLVNAVQALKGKGQVTVQAAAQEGSVELRIRDDGPGIAAEHLSRVFDPFFTTKPPGQGTGLGLSVSLGLLRNLGGSIQAVQADDGGAEFVLKIPRTPPRATARYNAARLSQPPAVPSATSRALG